MDVFMPVENKIKVFDSDDQSLKLFGELLSNDTSRKIIRSLINQEMYTNEIATKLDIRVSLVIHHLKKLEELGLVEITHKQIVRKGNNHRYFRMVPGMFLAPSHTKEEIENLGFLKKIFREGIKFTSIGIVAGFVWMFDIVNIGKPKSVYPEPFGQSVPQDPLILALIIVIIGLSILLVFSYKKRG